MVFTNASLPKNRCALCNVMYCVCSWEKEVNRHAPAIPPVLNSVMRVHIPPRSLFMTLTSRQAR